MGLKQFMARRAGKPAGRLSGIMAWLFNKGNANENSLAVEALELRGAEHVLELGFGGGASIALLLKALPNGKITGVDPTDEMLERARTVWAREISDGKLTVREGTAETTGAEANSFDAVLTMNTVYFWPDIGRGLEEIKRVLKPSGRVVIGVADAALLNHLAFRDVGHRVEPAEWYAEQLDLAGFLAVQVVDLNIKKRTRLVIGYNR